METIPPEDGKFCADCARLIGVRYMKSPEDVTKWRCGHAGNIEKEKLSLVTGIRKKIFRIEDIGNVRYGVCAKENWYEKYEEPQRYTQEGTEHKQPAPSKKSLADSL